MDSLHKIMFTTGIASLLCWIACLVFKNQQLYLFIAAYFWTFIFQAWLLACAIRSDIKKDELKELADLLKELKEKLNLVSLKRKLNENEN